MVDKVPKIREIIGYLIESIERIKRKKVNLLFCLTLAGEFDQP